MKSPLLFSLFFILLFFLPLSLFATGLVEMPVNSYMEELTDSFNQQLAVILLETDNQNNSTLYQETFNTYKEGIRYYAVVYHSQNFKYSTDPSTMINEMQQLQDLRNSVSLPSSFTQDLEKLKSWGFNLPTRQDVQRAFFH